MRGGEALAVKGAVDVLVRVGAWPRARETGAPVRLPVAGPIDAAAVARALVRDPGGVWLDDAPAGRHLIAWRPRALLRMTGAGVTLTGPEGACRLPADCFAWLDGAARALARPAPAARWFGYLGYELSGVLERLPAWQADDLGAPTALLGLHDVWLEGAREGWWLVAVPGWHTPRGIERLAVALRRRLAGLREVAEAVPPPAQAASVRVLPDDARFRAAVADTVRRIHAGELFQTNLCRRFELAWPERETAALYERMRRINPARYGAFMRLERGAVLSASPERFLRVRGRVLISDPIKGTRARGRDAREDRRRARDLLASAKDRAELAMIVDLARNDLGRVCLPGSVRVVRFPALMRLPTVIHTWARVRGRLRRGATPGQVLAATFPPASITGAPKIQAMIVARDKEPRRRGVSMGCIGWLANAGEMELSVAIRTALSWDGRLVYHAGCGIVADSQPEAECAESLDKARAFLRATGAEAASGTQAGAAAATERGRGQTGARTGRRRR